MALRLSAVFNISLMIFGGTLGFAPIAFSHPPESGAVQRVMQFDCMSTVARTIKLQLDTLLSHDLPMSVFNDGFELEVKDLPISEAFWKNNSYGVPDNLDFDEWLTTLPSEIRIPFDDGIPDPAAILIIRDTLKALPETHPLSELQNDHSLVLSNMAESIARAHAGDPVWIEKTRKAVEDFTESGAYKRDPRLEGGFRAAVVRSFYEELRDKVNEVYFPHHRMSDEALERALDRYFKNGPSDRIVDETFKRLKFHEQRAQRLAAQINAVVKSQGVIPYELGREFSNELEIAKRYGTIAEKIQARHQAEVAKRNEKEAARSKEPLSPAAEAQRRAREEALQKLKGLRESPKF